MSSGSKPRDWTGDGWPGRKAGAYRWYEIQDAIDYWQEFAKPKIVYQVIQYHPCFAFDRRGMLGNDKTFFLPSCDLYVLAVLNSPLMWWRNWRTFTHLKDEALSPMGYMMEALPIAVPSDEIRTETAELAKSLIETTERSHDDRSLLLDWLRVEHDVEKASQKLQAPAELDSDAFVAEVKRLRGRKNPLSAAGLKSLRDEYARTIEPMQARAAEALALERRLSDLVNEAYGLTPEEIDLMWKTAPPRMPFSR